MSRAKRLGRLVPLVAGVLLAVACGGPQEPGSAGTDCFRDDDCEPGLVCASLDPAIPGDRVCTDDVSGLVSTVPGPVQTDAARRGGGGSRRWCQPGGAPNGDQPAAGAPSQPAAGGAPSTLPPAAFRTRGAGGRRIQPLALTASRRTSRGCASGRGASPGGRRRRLRP